MSRPIICLDFDGCVHLYTSKWVSEISILDPPVPGAFEWIEKALELFEVHIYSRRSISEEGRKAMRLWFAANGGEHLLDRLTFAHEKPPAFLTIDDRAIRFTGSWGEPGLNPESLRTFKPWNR